MVVAQAKAQQTIRKQYQSIEWLEAKAAMERTEARRKLRTTQERARHQLSHSKRDLRTQDRLDHAKVGSLFIHFSFM